MMIQPGTAGVAPRGQASFLQGGISARYLPSAAVGPFATRRATLTRASGTQGVDCSINQHIPACQFPTTNCTNNCPDPATGSFCPTREFVQTCGGC